MASTGRRPPHGHSQTSARRGGHLEGLSRQARPHFPPPHGTARHRALGYGAPALPSTAVDSPTAAPAARISLALSPSGHLKLQAAREDEPAPEAATARRIEKLFGSDDAGWLFDFGASLVHAPLPGPLGFARDFGRRFVTALCGVAELEARATKLELPAPEQGELDALIRAAPPMTGGEYLSAELLTRWWSELLAAFKAQLRDHGGSAQALLASKDASWNVVGRVHFHLAENKRDPDRPFAFLATYTTGLGQNGKPQHRPLGEAVRESSSAKDRNRLLALLSPVRKAAELSAWAKELADSQQLFQPLAWTPREAHRFLLDIPALEGAGVLVRVPDWWKARRPPRPQVTVAVGSKAPSAFGVDALLDFKVSVTLDGEKLTAADLRALQKASDGLVLLKGRWVEVDRQKLDEVLNHWRSVEAQASDGITFVEGMRLLSGTSLGALGAGGTEATTDEVRSWFGVQAGDWLATTLQTLRREQLDGVGPKTLKADLRPYQRDGVSWLWSLARLRLGACLADDMGLGKTLQVLAVLLLAKEKGAPKGPHLLVVPASLIGNWKAEAARFAPSLKLFVAHSSEADAKTLAAPPAELLDGVDVVVTTYGAVQRLGWLTERSWGLVVLDEAQAIKNAGTKQARAVKGLKAHARIALTGTPVENRLGDLWSLFDFLNPGLLGGAKEFGAFAKQAQTYAPVRELIRPYLLRRLKTDRSIIGDLPDKTELRAFCGLTPRQAALYQQSVDALKGQLGDVEALERRGLILSYLMRLKQLCNHPSQWLGDGAYVPEESGKYARLQELCETIAAKQEKVLVFTQFREMCAPLSGWLTALFGREGLVLSGETAVKQRQALVKRFQEDEDVPFFVLSLKAGGTGLNLTAASHVIHFDRWWNPAVENQATDRAFRIGQKKNVLVHKLVCRGTIEERIDAMIEEKQSLSKELLEGGSELRLTELSDDELLKLVSLDVHRARAEG